MKILVTGCAGFIGSHTCERLLKENNQVMGIDNLNDYYDVNIMNVWIDYWIIWKGDDIYNIECIRSSQWYITVEDILC